MQPQTDGDYKKLFTELIKKQIIVLGPDITMAKVKNVEGIQVNGQGEVVSVQGDPQAILQNLINQFVELSGLIVKKTMESILTTYPGMAGVALNGSSPQPQAPISVQPPVSPQPAVMGANPFSDAVVAPPPASPSPSTQAPQQAGGAVQGQMDKEEMDSINKALSELSGQSSPPNQAGQNALENSDSNMSKSTSN